MFARLTFRPLAALFAGVLLGLGSPLVGAEAGFDWSTGDHHVALVTTNGDVVWQFNYPPAPSKPYFHPVALPGRPPLTWWSPPDHPWHLGLWFSWKFINGLNYWETDTRTGRSEGQTQVVAVRPLTRPDHSARLEVELAYAPAAEVAPVLRELRVVDISPPAPDGSYHIDWTMTFTAGSRAVRLDRTPIPGQPDGKPWGGYAGLIWRFPRAFTDWSAVNADGVTDLAAHGRRSSGCDFSGLLEGQSQGVAILDHPENVRAPTPWYVTMERDTPFACLMPAPLFERAHALDAGESITLRYRVMVHPHRWTAAQVRAAAAAFSAQR